LAICKRTGSGKCWRRRLRPLTSHAFVLLAFAAAPAAAQAADPGIATLEAFLDGVQTLTADFEQELWSAEQELQQTDVGSLWMKRPNRFRWEYEAPNKDGELVTSLVVGADGERLWIYDVEIAQVTVTPFDDTVGASPALLLSGDRNVREEFEVVDAYSADGLDWIKLEPIGSSDFSAVSIGFNGTEPRRLELVDGLGQVTRIVLDDLVVNPQIGDDVFELDVPEGVDVIGGEG
jgi:outer membrane lipoprotein carrier protein